MISQTNSGEGGTNGTNVTTGNSGGASGTAWALVSYPSGSITYATAEVQHGSLGYLFAPASGQQAVLRWTGYSDVTGVVRLYIPTSITPPSVTEALCTIYTSTGTMIMSIGITNAGKYTVTYNGGTLYIGTATPAAGDRLELSWTIGTTTSNGAWNYALYRGDATGTPTDSASGTTANLGTTNWDRVQFGKTSTSTWTGTFGMDDLAAASGTTTFFGPASVSNTPPTADAGPDQRGIEPFGTVMLDGTASSDTDGTIASYAWTQTAGTTVILSSSSTSQPTFTAPATIDGDDLVFSLVVIDSGGASSSPDTVTISILPHTMWRLDNGSPTAIQFINL